MLPSSDDPRSSSSRNGESSALRRFGPVVAIVAVIAVVAALVVAGGGGGDGGDDDAATDEPTERPAGAVSFSQAEAEGLDVTFPDTCDEERGTVAIPVSFAPECFADVDDNGGATHTGVTADAISVVIYIPRDDDAIIDFVTAPIANDDTSEQAGDTIAGFVELFDEYFQTYGRTVEYHVVEASGQSTDEVAAAADAARAIDEFRPFAAIGGPVLNNAWSSAMAGAGVVCVGCGLTGGQEFLEEREPYLYSELTAGVQNNVHVANYVDARLKGGVAEHGGDEVADEERVFGHLYLRTTEESDREAEVLYDLLDGRGVEIAEDAKASYSLQDLATLPEQVSSAIAKLKGAGVTTVLLQGDPYGPSLLLAEATEQDYHPEWVIAGGLLLDSTGFGRTFDQEQWSHAFGITSLVARATPERNPAVLLYDWYYGEGPPADETAGVLWRTPFLLFRALQAAGPDLTPETFRAGLFSLDEGELRITDPHDGYGEVPAWEEIGIERDYSGPDDKTEIWWDPAAQGPDEVGKEGTGMVRYVRGGQRHLPGDWAGTEDHLFDPEGSTTVYDEAPPGEEAPDYPSPAG